MATDSKNSFRIVDGMVMVAATAFAFAMVRAGIPARGYAFTTFGGNWEQWVFYWMHLLVPFPAMWSLAVFLIAMRGSGARRRARCAGVAACAAAAAVVAVTAIVSSGFYALHVMEDFGMIRKILSHATVSHLLPPFGGAQLEEIGGGAVAGAWAALLASRRWRTEPTWIDRAGRVLGIIWIVLLLLYLYGYAG